MARLELFCPAQPSDTGAYRLSWQGPEGAEYRLVEIDGDGQRVIYEGADMASTVTGRTDGDYGYRLELTDGGPAAAVTCAVTVDPPPMSLAIGLFAVGLGLCLATVVLITRGHRAHRRGEIG